MHVASPAAADRTVAAERLTLHGRVQGLGVRPALARLAIELRLAGSVRNTGQGVVLDIEGPHGAIVAFHERLEAALPAGALLEQVVATSIASHERTEFTIHTSSAFEALAAQVPPDRAVCEACLAEVAQRGDMRYGYPFTCCTACGPRYSLMRAMPYDRAQTSMADFAFCHDCRREYDSLADRRFHAETIACPQCGPHIWISANDLGVIAERDAAIDVAVDALRRASIVALCGVGGYQLLVDATNDEAVERLRARKARAGKPLAVLVASLDDALQIGHLDDAERQTLLAASNAIVIVERRCGATLAPGVCGEFDTVGLMLPTTPLHEQLLARVGRPLVATSGNVEGEPLAFEIATAQKELASVADYWLHHDRAIVRPIDDSVVRVVAGRAVSLRLARGLAPLALDVSTEIPILALGAHQKVALAFSNTWQAALGPHIGDLDGRASRERFREQVASFTALYGAEASLIVHDLHPDYFTTRYASEQGCHTLAVQHHHAHAAAAMLEHGWLDREVLALTWDGTGYAPDGSLWGGECLLATGTQYRRVAHCRPFLLPGGEKAIREPWRTAISLVEQAAGFESAAKLDFDHVAPATVTQMARLATRAHLSPQTTSIGRLFDGVASLVLGITHASFEGEAAMRLEAACDPSVVGAYDLPLSDGCPAEIDWRPLLVELLADRAARVSPSTMATRFHRALAAAAVALGRRFANYPLALAGGVFQNRVLVELIAENWPYRAERLGLPGVIPPGDGGIAAGQLAIAAAHWRAGGIR